MRIANVRIVFQVVLLGLFLACLWLAAAPRIAGYPTSVFLEADPLVAVTTALSTGHLYHVAATGLLLGAGVLVLTILLGRAFCGWVCPFGTMHHVAHWFGFSRRPKARIEGNRYRRWYALKVVVLFALLAGALLGVLQIGLLDPIALLSRSMADAVLPVIDAGLRGLGLSGIHPSATPVYAGAWFVGLLFLALLGLNVLIPRFFCRALCPLGALLGLTSRFALFRIHRDEASCTGCGRCAQGCEGAAEPDGKVRLAECMVCMNCVEDCPEGSIRWRFLPPERTAAPAPALRARRAVLAGAGGLFLFASLRGSGAAVAATARRGVLRPPAALPEEEFLARCIKCDACLTVCPTNVLHPAAFEAGFEGLWTPVMDFRTGYCDVECALCGRVCPTGAIERVTTEERRARPVVIGTASYDRGRCLPWAMDTPCVVCEEVCPVSPKAISTRDGLPRVDPALCVGCGICEHECPVRGPAAIRVGARIAAPEARDGIR